jgi:hypothetical protein
MTTYLTSLTRLAATIVVVANLVAIGFQALAGGTAVTGVLIAAGLATIGPLLVALADVKATAWVLTAFVLALIGDAVAFGVPDITGAASTILLFGLVVSLLVCVAATLARAQTSLENPKNRL